MSVIQCQCGVVVERVKFRDRTNMDHPLHCCLFIFLTLIGSGTSLCHWNSKNRSNFLIESAAIFKWAGEPVNEMNRSNLLVPRDQPTKSNWKRRKNISPLPGRPTGCWFPPLLAPSCGDFHFFSPSPPRCHDDRFANVSTMRSKQMNNLSFKLLTLFRILKVKLPYLTAYLS